MHTHFYIIMASFRTFWTPVRYPDDEMLKEAVWRDRQKNFILVLFNSLPEKFRKCIELSRDYIEK